MGDGQSVSQGSAGAGSLVSGIGSYYSGMANQKIDRYNAELADRQAEQAILSGEYAENISDLKAKQMFSAQTSSFASQGVVVGAGTAGAVTQASMAMSEADKRIIRMNAYRQAMGYSMQAVNYRNQANIAYTQGVMSGVGSLVQGGGAAAAAILMA